ncbi:MAG: ABC transporter ATP-binding protein [Paludibacteraceae bacterium]|nr:ABC transporter ATP-binding protein [Paludibacteraceae bacterium]
MPTAIEFSNISKQYRLGLVSTRTLSHDLNRWWKTKILHKEDPYLKIGEVNDQSHKGESEYIWALKDINLKVEQGEVLGIIGKNGAGKSTLLKILSKVTAPTTGTIKVNGRIASLLEVGTGFHPEMTGRENIYMNGAILGMTKKEIDRKLDEIVDFSGVERYIDTPVKRYSSGMTVRLGFAIAAHLEPEILVVDEVLAVGDAEFQKKAIGKMQDVSKGDGRTVLFVSHNMESIQNLCTSGILLGNGSIVKSGRIEEVVDYYISGNLASVEDVGLINDTSKYRPKGTTKEVEFLYLERVSKYQIDVNDPLIFRMKLKRNAKIKKIQLMALIDDISNGGNRVGLSFSDELILPEHKNEFDVEFTIAHHHLTKNRYIMDFWIGIGDVTSSIKYYDMLYDTLTFEISTCNGKFINEWHSYWGQNCYSSVNVTLK